MAFGDLTRINSNGQALSSLSTLQKTNQQIGERQLRLATGSRINKAEDDSAGYSISKKLEAKVRGQAQALSNIGDAKSMLSVAEGGLNSTMDILQTMKEKSVQAANDTLGTNERDAIEGQLKALTSEMKDVLDGVEFNGTKIFTTGGTSLNFQVGASNATQDLFEVDVAAISVGPDSASLFSADASVFSGGVWDVGSSSNARAALGALDGAIQEVADRLGGLGDSQTRLTFKQDNLTTSMNNYEAARSRIADADFAKEQMEIVKMQILQQTGTATLAQANSAPQSVLSLF